MPTVGLTGNFGMGKSTVLSLFHGLGAHTFSSDDYVHEILGKPDTAEKIAGVLGRRVLTETPSGVTVNKKTVAGIIFSDPRKRRAVEDILHPQVLSAIKKTRAGILANDPYAVIVFEVPLLFEAGYEDNFDFSVMVFCSRATAVKRLAAKHISKNEFESRIRAQLPVSEKKRRADFVIDNNGSISRTEKRVRRIYAEVRKSGSAETRKLCQ